MVVVITFLTMYNKNQFFTIHMGSKKNILLAKNKYKKTLLTCSKSLRKK